MGFGLKYLGDLEFRMWAPGLPAEDWVQIVGVEVLRLYELQAKLLASPLLTLFSSPLHTPQPPLRS